MIFTDSLLDTSWALQFMPGIRRNFKRLDDFINTKTPQSTSGDTFERLAENLHDHLSYRGENEPKDELNDQTTKYGHVSRCSISPIEFSSTVDENSEPLGLLIEARYQLAAYRVTILRIRERRDGTQDLALIFFKGNQKFINHVRDWLDITFELPPPEVLQIASHTLLQIFSGFIDVVSTGWPPDTSGTDALRLAILKQVIGNVKITITITAAETDLTTKLKHIELDIPCDTINEIISLNTVSTASTKSAGSIALEGLKKGICEKTGLNLPFVTDQANDDQLQEQPCKVSKIACAAFAVSTEGRLKLSGKPIEQAELTGFEESLVRNAMSRILETLNKAAESRIRDP